MEGRAESHSGGVAVAVAVTIAVVAVAVAVTVALGSSPSPSHWGRRRRRSLFGGLPQYENPLFPMNSRRIDVGGTWSVSIGTSGSSRRLSLCAAACSA